MATTRAPLAARARSIGSSAMRSLRRQAPPCTSRTVGKRPRALRLVDARHQLSPARRAVELHLADLQLELPRWIVGTFHTGPPLGLARSRQHRSSSQRRLQAQPSVSHSLQKVAAVSEEASGRGTLPAEPVDDGAAHHPPALQPRQLLGEHRHALPTLLRGKRCRLNDTSASIRSSASWSLGGPSPQRPPDRRTSPARPARAPRRARRWPLHGRGPFE